MSQRLQPSQRIRKRETFQILFKKGRCIRGKLLNLWAYSGEEAFSGPSTKPKIGIVVSRKVHLRANKRNLWKRRIREAFRLSQNKIKVKTAVLIQARKQATIPTYQEIADEFEKLLSKARCLRGPKK